MAFKKLIGAVLCMQVACAGPQVGRTGPAVALPNGAPRNDCEREDWYEVAPARVQATGATAGVLVNTYYSQRFAGLAVFRHEQHDPEDLENVWPNMGEPALQRKHQAKIEPVDEAHRRTLLWSLGGLTVGFIGLGIAATEDQNRSVATAAGVTGLAALLIGAIGALASQPSGEAQLHADARRKLFIDGEDDRVAVERGVNNANGRRRARCGGTPASPAAPQPVPEPAPAPSAPTPDDASRPLSGEQSASPPAETTAAPEAPGTEEQGPADR